MGNPAEIAHGPILLGFTVNAVLLGVMCMQIYMYYTSFKKDKIWIKVFVAVLLSLDIFNTACMTAYLYKALVVHFGDAQYLDAVTWLFQTAPTSIGVIVSCVQCFYAWRIWVLTRSKILTIVTVVTALVGGVSSIATPVKVAQAPFFVDIIRAKAPIVLWISAEAFGDILITATLVTYLCRTGFTPSDTMIDRIIRMTIQTGLLTATFAIVVLLLYLLDTNTGFYILFNMFLCKLYSNSLMSTLNSRGALMRLSSGETSTKSWAATEGQIISMPNFNQTSKAIQITGNSGEKPSEIVSHNCNHTEIYVTVESQQRQDCSDSQGKETTSLSDHETEADSKPMYDV